MIYFSNFDAAGGGSAVAPTFGAVGTHSAGVINAAYPAGISAGDLLELVIVQNGGDGTTAYSATGWSAGASYMGTFTGAPTGGGNMAIHVLRKIATGSESGTVTVSRAGTAPTREGAVIERFSGVDTSGTIHEGLGTGTISDTGPLAGAITTPAITTTANGRLLVNRFASPIVVTKSPGAGYTEAYEVNRSGVGPDYIFSMDYKDATGFGAQSSEVATAASQTAMVMLSYALIGL